MIEKMTASDTLNIHIKPVGFIPLIDPYRSFQSSRVIAVSKKKLLLTPDPSLG